MVMPLYEIGEPRVREPRSLANNVNERPRESGGSTGGSSRPTKSRFGSPGLPGYISMYEPETMVEKPEMPPTPTCGAMIAKRVLSVRRPVAWGVMRACPVTCDLLGVH